MSEKERRKQIAKISIFITSIFVLFISISYAFITQTLTGTKKQVINAGVLDLVLEEDNEITISDALPMYDEVGMIQEENYVFRLINNTTNETNYILKLNKIETSNLSETLVKYGLVKDGETTIALLSTLEDGVIDSGTIAGSGVQNYELRLWIDSSVNDATQISGKMLSYTLNVEVNQEIASDTSLSTVSTKLFASETLGENCKTYDDGTDTFLVGQCSQNYVWYSGKLWRVVLKNNETGAVKLVTDNAITAIPYNASGNTAFENSYMDQWLNQEFLLTLHDYSDYLVTTSVWDATENSSDTPSRPSYTTSVTRTVGLLNAYEYYTTYTNSDELATFSTGYLNNGVYWWLMTPYNASNVRYVNFYGNLSDNYPTDGYGARPSVNLKSTIQIVDGTGTQSNPYILEGDLQEMVNGTTLLNTRYSGEYITFNNDLYRIVGVEEGLTKITAVDKPSALSDNEFDTEGEISNFANAPIKTDLENYYQALATSNEAAYNMIQPSTTWYLGTVGQGVNYKASICATVDASTSMNACTEKATSTAANIGLPRVGEMFTSQITRGTIDDFWTLTPYDTTLVRHVSNYGSLNNGEPTYGFGARPSMYLKSGVKIASSNTGNGTYEYPYSLELGE